MFETIRCHSARQKNSLIAFNYDELTLKVYFKLLSIALLILSEFIFFRESAQNLSRRFLDQPLSSLDTAIYWIEYVVKYGSDVLRSPAVDLTWWQLSLIDVYAFILICVTIIVIAVVFIARFILKMINGNRSILQFSKKTN